MPDLRVFISSTFQDLQEEREHLVKKIFPQIRSLCRERGIAFTEVDLRWGLTAEDMALGQVIRTCLEEVDKCRPYFIGITGERYGFVPTYLDIQKDPALLEQYPWIEEAAIEGMSITEMEVQYGVLTRPERSGRSSAHFYFRRHRRGYDPVGEAAEELHRLEAYQERIRASGESVEQFRDPVSLGEMIYDDLVSIIERDFADARPPTSLEEERSRHEAFALSRRRAYIANPQHLKRLNDHVASEDPPLVVYAESGSGKSSLFAWWAEQYRRKHPEAQIIEHYVGIGATATDHLGVIRHICMEINERFGRDEEIPSEPAKLEAALGQWLGYAEHGLRKASLIPHSSSLIIIIDGLNQLQGEALNLRWIPDVITPGIRLMLSSTVEGTLVELKRRGWGRYGMQALSEAERETIIVRYLAEYHKSLNAEQVKRLAGDDKCSHPLFLKTVLEELRLVGRHEELDAKIGSYLEATGTEDLFQRLLERLEEDYSQRSVREVLVLLSASRSGLDERELSEISGLARLKVGTMIAGLEYHLVRKGGHLTFFHDYLRRAVEKRYLSEGARQRSAHLQLAEYFDRGVRLSIATGGKVPVRLASELAWQLEQGGAMERLAEVLGTIPVFLSLYQGRERFEVQGYCSRLRKAGMEVEGIYGQGLARWDTVEAEERIEGLGAVAALLESLGIWSMAMDLQRERVGLAMERSDGSQEADSRRSLGWLLILRGEYAEASAELERAHAISEELGDRSGVAWAIGNMGMVYYSRGEYEQALASYQQNLAISEELGNRSGVAATIGHIGLVYYSRGEHERALASYQQNLAISEELGDRGSVALAIGNMGMVYESRGEHERALASYQQQLAISEELGDRSGVAWAIGNMGDVYYSRGEHEQALANLHRAAEEHRALDSRYDLANWLEGTARVLTDLAEPSEQNVPMPEYLPRYVPEATAATWQAMALQQARTSAEECVAISEELSTPDTLFDGRVLLARIDAAEGRAEDGMGQLAGLLEEASDDGQRAELHYWSWKLGTPGVSEMNTEMQDHRHEALQLYRALFEKAPEHEYTKRIEELEHTPDRSP